MSENTMLRTEKDDLKEYFNYSISVNLEGFKRLSRKYLEYKLEQMGLEYKEIQHIETGSDPQKSDVIMYAKFKVDELDIVIKKMLIHNTEPDNPYVIIECDECHEKNEQPFSTPIELMAAINYFSSHKLHTIRTPL